ncbi:hypothetical protein GE09DRAFT_1111618 [Coniochaeta sp. 2T2.1]|nr:hypothetical protein GE09DRAFT_1111618 [Coniochaeta sp. 2T2.1]
MPQPQENARAFILLILIFWLLTSPDNSPGLIGVPYLTTARLERQRFAHGVLNTTKWGDFSPRLIDDQADATPHYLNLTGFREQDGFAWEDLGRFRDRCSEWSRNAHGSSSSGENLWDAGLIEPTWQNVTGVVHGEWVRRNGSVERQGDHYNLTAVAPDVAFSHGDYSHNVTGQHGKITLYLHDKDDSAEYQDRDGDHGPKAGGLARAIQATVTIQDDATSSSSWDMKFHGVHWPRQGAILLTSTSEKFAGIFGLPHLTPGPNFFYSSQILLNETLDKILAKKERTTFSDPSNPWTSNLEPESQSWNPSPHCEYLLYAQVYPFNPQQVGTKHPKDPPQERLGMGSLVQNLENELRRPTGAPVQGYPELHLSTVMWSPDCSYFVESKGPPVFASVEGKHLTGKKEEIIIYGGKMWLMSFAAVFLGQVYLLKAQMRESSTPSTVGRVSFYTAGIMLLADGLIFTASSAWSVSANSTLLPSLLMTFGAFLSMALGGVFLGEVYKVQEPERRNHQREQAAAHPPPPTPAAAAAAAAAARAASAASPPPSDSLPRPVTAAPLRPASPPIIIPSDQDIDAEIAANATAGAAAVLTPLNTAVPSSRPTPTTTVTYPPEERTTFSSISGRFILIGLLILFVSIAAISWPAPIRAFYCDLLAFVYFSLWVPQIYRNIIRNSRRAYSWRFMIGQSVLRAAPIAYFYLREDNILFAKTDPIAFAVLAGWLWTQLWILAFQDVLGPRYLIPKSWVPEAWDYHPILREDNLEAGGLPIGLVLGADEDEPGSPSVTRRASVSEGNKSTRKERDRDRGKDRKDGKGDDRPHIHEIDCAICRETLEVPVVPAGADPDAVGAGGSVSATLARRTYMVTPCRHIFHSACLEGWLRFRLQCPICREELPPL